MADRDPFAERSLRVGYYLNFYPDISQTDLEVGVKFWGEEISKAENIPIVISFYDDIELMRTDFEQGKINYVVLSAWAVVKHFKRDLLADGFKASRNGKSLDNLIVVTRKHEGLDDYTKLVGKKLGMLSNDPVAEVYLDVLSLTHLAKPYKLVFKQLLLEKKSTQLVYSLFFKKNDAIVIYQTSYELAIELNPQIREQTQIIDTVLGIPWGTGFFHKNVPSDFRELLIAGALKVEDTARGRQLMQIFHADKLERSKLSDLEAIESLTSRLKQLQRKHKR